MQVQINALVSHSGWCPTSFGLGHLHGQWWNWSSKGDDEMALVMNILILAVDAEGVNSRVVVML